MSDKKKHKKVIYSKNQNFSLLETKVLHTLKKSSKNRTNQYDTPTK